MPAAADVVAQAKGKSKGKTRAPAADAWGTAGTLALLSQLATEKAQRGDPAPLVVAVAGVTNAGKTALVNALLGRAALRTYAPAASTPDAPTTTAHPQAVAVELVPGRAARVVDTPGLAWLPLEGADDDAAAASARARDILVRNRGRIERLKDPAPVCESAPFVAV